MKSPIDNAVIIKAIRQRKKNSFNLLLDYYDEYITATCRSLVNSNKSEVLIEDDDDVKQMALIKIYQNIFRFNFECSLSSWIYIICKREFLLKIRSSQRIRKIQRAAEDLNLAIVGKSHIDHHLDYFFIEKLKREIKLLQACKNPKVADTSFYIATQLLEQLTHKEVAKELNISVPASKSRYLRLKALIGSLIYEIDDSGEYSKLTANYR